MRSQTLALVVVVGSCIGALPCALAQTTGFTVLAAGGSDVIPALGPNLTDQNGPLQFFLFGSGPEAGPSVARNGDVFFIGRSNTIADAIRDDSIFRHRNGQNIAIVREASSGTSNTGIPATPAFFLDFNPFSPPSINRSQPVASADGSILFWARVGTDQFSSQQSGVFRRSASGVITPFVLTGSDGPLGPGLGAGEVFESNSFGISHSQEGEALFRGGVTNAQFQQRAILMTFSANGSQRRTIGLRGQPAPGSTGVFGEFFSIVPPSFTSDSTGQLARFRSDFQAFGTGGLFTANGASVAPFALSGTDGALGPGLGVGAMYSSGGGGSPFLGSVGSSTWGAAAFTRVFVPSLGTTVGFLTRFSLSGPPAHLAGIYGFSGGPLGPALGEGVHFANFSDPMINDQGLIAFGATLQGANVNFRSDAGVFVVPPNAAAAVCIAREGDINTPLAPPGLAGWRFASGMSMDLQALQIAVNGAGDVVFTAVVESPTFQTRAGLFAWSASTGLRTIAVGGITTFPANVVGTEVVYGFSSILFNGWSGGNDGRSSGLGEDGSIHFQAIIDSSVPTPRSFPVMIRFGATGPVCDSVDFNNDTSFFDPTDVDAFLSVFSEGPCIPAGATCNDVDFNNDGSIFDPCDVDSFLLVFSEGPCTLCGV